MPTKKYESFYESNEYFVECIQEIEMCALLKRYKTGIPCFVHADTSKAMMKFVDLYNRLFNERFTQNIQRQN